MLSRLELAVDLLHFATDAALATQSASMPGYPFASSVPFIVDEHQCPIVLISRLAEHTRNLAANPRTSLMISKSMGDGEMARVTLLGDAIQFAPDSALVARYIRFHPHADRFLQLGDFTFWRLTPIRVMTIGGFAKASWIEGDRLFEAPMITLAQEDAVIASVTEQVRPDICILGIDAYGIDVRVNQERMRLRFAVGPVTFEALIPTLLREFEKLNT